MAKLRAIIKFMAWLVYILKTDSNTLYTGITNNLKRRLEAHMDGKGAKYLRGFSDIKLVYKEECTTRSEALKREYQIKKMTQRQKLELCSFESHMNIVPKQVDS